jgi:hypothetical protein
MARRRRRRLAWAGALAVSAMVHAGLLTFLVQDRGGTALRPDLSAVEVELARPPPEAPSPERRKERPARAASAGPQPAEVRQPPPQAEMVQPYVAAPAERPVPGGAAQGPQPGLSLDGDPCAPARRASLSAWQRERCDRRGRDYVDFSGGKRAPQFEQPARQGYVKPDQPYLPRKPEHGCKPYAAPLPSTSTSDQVMAGIACAWKF